MESSGRSVKPVLRLSGFESLYPHMAKVIVRHDNNPDVFVALEVDDEANWDGSCSVDGCDFTLSEGGTRFTGAEDALVEASLHVDRRHAG